MTAPRHAVRTRLDVRPLDRFTTIKIKLGVLVTATVTLAAFITWIGLYNHLGPTRTLPLAVVVSLIAVQVLAHGMTSPLREMTAAAQAMAQGDYSRRVTASSHDEVGRLAAAFNTMAEDLEQADLLRRELVANVSHELRTPVAALQAQLENLVDGVSPADPETLGAALHQTERLGSLVADLLDLSRLEAGAVGLEVAPIQVRELLDDVVQGARLIAPAKELDLAVEVEPGDLTVAGDAKRLDQVVTNLVQNAVRHSPRGGRIALTARREGREVVLDVVDQGPGIPREDRARVFERFTRGNVPAVTGQISTGGTGLGLAIVRWAVQLHGGTVEVVDSDKGCDMQVRLPIQPPGAPTSP
ncbi:ATP-binding protein [Isoptericola sp. b441]|uniref:histidine kinase n=1 Tax=Actinotalea lenta TaxID=3064654 RepID=A0ABT9DCI4_9CELL|nr:MULTISPECIES: ATP-binding protein [unclassified Isoptericola]MDO8108614.1 ATP-binding protein [Isoptericola sp. b441]MDO8120024.1 ATP-binding protein [Isoptericola sp. b490]